MATRRFFYVTQEELIVWLEARAAFDEVARFGNTDRGFRDFSDYLEADPQRQSLMLVDVIEEEFADDTVPKLPLRDRNALIERRLMRKYSRTPYRLGHFQGRGRSRGQEQEVLYSAVSNHELLDPWLKILVAHCTPLVGVFSVPLLGARLLKRIRKPARHALLLTQHQRFKLRQVYLRDGKLKSARLSQSPGIADPSYGDSIFTEIQRSRRYLERSRLLGSMEDVDVYMITDIDTAERIIASDKGKVPLKFHFVKPQTAARAVRLSQVPDSDRLETLYLAIAAQGRLAHNYARREETHYHRLSWLRRVVVGAALASAFACSIVAGINVMNALHTRHASGVIDQQIRRMEETFRRENDRFAPMRADSHEMKLAVDTGDYILDNRLPVAWVMRQVGSVLGSFPQIQVDELSWELEAPDDGQAAGQAARRANQPEVVRIKPLHAIKAELSGQLVPFDGNLRRAFATIERLAAALEADTAFDEVQTTEFPLDASPKSSLSGEVVNPGMEPAARFRIRLRLALPRGDAA